MSANKKYIRCFKCKGIGLQTREDKYICANCNDKNKTCYLCENVSKMLWEICIKCRGSGQIEMYLSQKKVVSNTI